MTRSKIKLKDVAAYHTGKIATKDVSIENYISTTNMLEGKLGVEKALSLPPSNKVNEYVENDILISNIRPYFKKIWFANKDGGCSTDILNIRANLDKIDSRFLYYCLYNDSFFEYVMVGAKGVKMPRGDKNFIMEYEIPEYDKDHQERIVSMLEPYFDKVESNLRLINHLNEYIELLYYQWFIEFKFPNFDGKLVDVDGKMLPKKWERITVDGAVSKIIDHRGKTPKKLGSEWAKEGTIALSAKIVKNGQLVNLEKANKVDEELYKKWMKDELMSGDILMTSEAPLGEFYLILNDEKYCLSQRLFALRSNERVLPSYLYLELSQTRGKKGIMARQSGSTVFGIRQEELRKVKLVLPPIEVQQAFDKIVNPMLHKIRQCENQNRKLVEMRDLLIRKLI